MIKVNIISNRNTEIMYLSSDKMQQDHQTTPGITAAPNTEPQSIHEETSDKFILKDSLQNNWPVIFKSINVMKIKENLKNSSKLKMTKET